MLLRPRNELRIWLGPHRLCVTRCRHSWRGVEEDVTAMACVSTGPKPWSGAITALDSILAQDTGNAARTTVILSNHWVRYLLVPWNSLFAGKEEQTAYVQHLFSEIYGHLSTDYELRLSGSAPGLSRIASAVKTTLLQQLREICDRRCLQLQSIQPHMMAAFNQHRRRIPKQGGWFVLHENGLIGLLAITDGHWQQVRTLRTGSQWPRDLKSLLDRLYLNGDAERIDRNIFWRSSETGSAQLSLPAPWKVTRLDGEDTPVTPQDAMVTSKVTHVG